jgi:hypothetical protein
VFTASISGIRDFGPFSDMTVLSTAQIRQIQIDGLGKNRPNLLARKAERMRPTVKQYGRFLRAYPVQSVHAS